MKLNELRQALDAFNSDPELVFLGVDGNEIKFEVKVYVFVPADNKVYLKHSDTSESVDPSEVTHCDYDWVSADQGVSPHRHTHTCRTSGHHTTHTCLRCGVAAEHSEKPFCGYLWGGHGHTHECHLVVEHHTHNCVVCDADVPNRYEAPCDYEWVREPPEDPSRDHDHTCRFLGFHAVHECKKCTDAVRALDDEASAVCGFVWNPRKPGYWPFDHTHECTKVGEHTAHECAKCRINTPKI